MIVKNIHYSSQFIKEFKRLSESMQQIAIAKEILFRQNPLHPSLRLHALKGSLDGMWSLSFANGYRIIFTRKENGDILFGSIGTHDVYKNL